MYLWIHHLNDADFVNLGSVVPVLFSHLRAGTPRYRQPMVLALFGCSGCMLHWKPKALRAGTLYCGICLLFYVIFWEMWQAWSII